MMMFIVHDDDDDNSDNDGDGFMRYQAHSKLRRPIFPCRLYTLGVLNSCLGLEILGYDVHPLLAS